MILKKFNVERVTDDPAVAVMLKKDGFEELVEKKPAKARKKKEQKDVVDE